MWFNRRTRFFSKRPAISQAVSQRRVLAVLRNALPSYQRRCLPHEQFCHFSPSDAYQGGCVNRNRMYFWVIDKMNAERLTREESHFYEQFETYLRTRLPTPCVSQYSFRQSGRAKPKMAGSSICGFHRCRHRVRQDLTQSNNKAAVSGISDGTGNSEPLSRSQCR